MTAILPSLAAIPARPPRQVDFGIQSTHPAYSLSTLQTPRCRDACKTRYWPACLALARLDFHQQVDTSFAQRNYRTTPSFATPRWFIPALPHVPHQSLSQARATSMPDATWAVSRSPPGSSLGWNRPSVLASSATFSTPHRWFTLVRLLGSHL